MFKSGWQRFRSAAARSRAAAGAFKHRDAWKELGLWVQSPVFLLFVPGAVLSGLGIFIWVFPHFLAQAVAVCFLFLGFFSAYAAYRLLLFKQRLESSLKDFGGHVLIQGIAPAPFDHESERKKIVYH